MNPNQQQQSRYRWLITPLIAGKPWNGSTIHEQPLGGSEAAVVYTARALAKLGQDVWVTTQGVEKETVIEGVHYFPVQQIGMLQQMYWDVLISSRWVEALNNMSWHTRCAFLWIHDLNQHGGIQIHATRVVALTEFQRGAWGVPEELSAIIGDGVDMELFDSLGDLPRDENKVLWVSNPDRGLNIACKIFQTVRQRWPDLELHVYGRSSVYGWGPEMELPYLPRDEYTENVVLHDPLPRAGLAKELKSAWAVFYPTYWPETYCMATLEAQAGGCPVIAAPYGALPETIKGGVLTWDFLNAFSQLRNKRRWDKLSSLGTEWARGNTWDIRAREWVGLAEEVLNAQS